MGSIRSIDESHFNTSKKISLSKINSSIDDGASTIDGSSSGPITPRDKLQVGPRELDYGRGHSARASGSMSDGDFRARTTTTRSWVEDEVTPHSERFDTISDGKCLRDIVETIQDVPLGTTTDSALQEVPQVHGADPYREPRSLDRTKKYVFPHSSCMVPKEFEDRSERLVDDLKIILEKESRSDPARNRIHFKNWMYGRSSGEASPAIVILAHAETLSAVKATLYSFSHSVQQQNIVLPARYWTEKVWRRLFGKNKSHHRSSPVRLCFCPVDKQQKMMRKLSGHSIQVLALTKATNHKCWYGTKITDHRHRSHFATLTCFLAIGGSLYGLTTAHAFSKEHDIANSLSAAWSIFIPSATNSKDNVVDLDWALVRIPPDSVQCSEGTASALNHLIPDDKNVAKAHPREERKVLIFDSAQNPPKQGALLCGTTFAIIDGRGPPAPLWSVKLDEDGDLAEGDSGSLVIDADTKQIYGFVIALAYDDTVHLVPLHRALQQITNIFGSEEVSMANPADLASELCKKEEKKEECLSEIVPPLPQETNQTGVSEDKSPSDDMNRSPSSDMKWSVTHSIESTSTTDSKRFSAHHHPNLSSSNVILPKRISPVIDYNHGTNHDPSTQASEAWKGPADEHSATPVVKPMESALAQVERPLDPTASHSPYLSSQIAAGDNDTQRATNLRKSHQTKASVSTFEERESNPQRYSGFTIANPDEYFGAHKTIQGFTPLSHMFRGSESGISQVSTCQSNTNTRSWAKSDTIKEDLPPFELPSARSSRVSGPSSSSSESISEFRVDHNDSGSTGSQLDPIKKSRRRYFGFKRKPRRPRSSAEMWKCVRDHMSRYIRQPVVRDCDVKSTLPTEDISTWEEPDLWMGPTFRRRSEVDTMTRAAHAIKDPWHSSSNEPASASTST